MIPIDSRDKAEGSGEVYRLPVRVAVIDSGVNPRHPHICKINGGVSVGASLEEDVYLDFLGHGTAVMAAIQERAPHADYYAVRLFQQTLRTSIEHLARAVEWCFEQRMDVINLSLGTANAAHRELFERLVERAKSTGSVLVSALDSPQGPCLPGSLPGVIGVGLDWNLPREQVRVQSMGERRVLMASGYPRPLPGLPQERNLQGVSFAVANACGHVVNACAGVKHRTAGSILDRITAQAEHSGV